jgi:hypothetical protein
VHLGILFGQTGMSSPEPNFIGQSAGDALNRRASYSFVSGYFAGIGMVAQNSSLNGRRL